MSTHNFFIIVILNTLMFSMLFHLCKFTTACHSLKNVNENQPKKKKSVHWAKQITTEVWYLRLHLEFKQQVRLQAAKKTLHKVSFTTTNEWYKLKLNLKKTT